MWISRNWPSIEGGNLYYFYHSPGSSLPEHSHLSALIVQYESGPAIAPASRLDQDLFTTSRVTPNNSIFFQHSVTVTTLSHDRFNAADTAGPCNLVNDDLSNPWDENPLCLSGNK